MATRPEDALAGMIANLKATTGKALEEWAELMRPHGFTKHGEMMAFLKGEHGVSHGYANQIALNVRKPAEAANSDPVEEMFKGPKAAVRPIYDDLLGKIKVFGSDVDIAPKKGYVSVRRTKQFALLQPASSRVDVGLILKGEPTTDRLEASGSFNAMFTHRVRVGSLAEVDDQLLGWLKKAFDAA